MQTVDCLIVGAGQAGLSAGYYVNKSGLSHVIIDRSQRVGDVWRKRYDSLKLFSPRFCNYLPGEQHMCGTWRGYPTKDEMADYLEDYAKNQGFYIKHGTSVTKIIPQGETYLVQTDKGDWQARSVILATGGFNSPKIPSFAENLPTTIQQIHSTQYQNPQQLDTSGSVVVVGGGNSGVQIARELSLQHPTHFVFDQSHRRFYNNWVARRFAARLGILHCSPRSLAARLIWKDQKEPIIGSSKKQFFNNPNLVSCGHILELHGDHWICSQHTIENISTIVRATGFKQDWSRTGLEGLCDEHGKIIQNKGITSLPGVYVLGLPWMMQKGSATVGGVGKDAKKIVRLIQHQVSQETLT